MAQCQQPMEDEQGLERGAASRIMVNTSMVGAGVMESTTVTQRDHIKELSLESQNVGGNIPLEGVRGDDQRKLSRKARAVCSAGAPMIPSEMLRGTFTTSPPKGVPPRFLETPTGRLTVEPSLAARAHAFPMIENKFLVSMRADGQTSGVVADIFPSGSDQPRSKREIRARRKAKERARRRAKACVAQEDVDGCTFQEGGLRGQDEAATNGQVNVANEFDSSSQTHSEILPRLKSPEDGNSELGCVTLESK